MQMIRSQKKEEMKWSINEAICDRAVLYLNSEPPFHIKR